MICRFVVRYFLIDIAHDDVLSRQGRRFLSHLRLGAAWFAGLHVLAAVPLGLHPHHASAQPLLPLCSYHWHRLWQQDHPLELSELQVQPHLVPHILPLSCIRFQDVCVDLLCVWPYDGNRRDC